MPLRSEHLPLLLHVQFPLLLKSHDDHRGSGHHEAKPVELIMSREGKLKKAVTAAPVTIEELHQRKLEIKHLV